jgi:hypothetical protein
MEESGKNTTEYLPSFWEFLIRVTVIIGWCRVLYNNDSSFVTEELIDSKFIGQVQIKYKS